MRRPVTPAARRALSLYDDAPRGDRFHVRTRWWTCPFDALERRVPAAGRVLEVGCGHGLLAVYLALAGPDRVVTGVDIDAHKIDLAAQAASRLEPDEAQVGFAAVAPGEFVAGTFDAIVIADVLYLLDPDARKRLLAACVQHLADGGVLLVKETDRLPRWKGAITVAQERLATGVLGITAGDGVDFAAPEELADQLRGNGLDVVVERVDRGYPHPHVLLVGRRCATGGVVPAPIIDPAPGDVQPGDVQPDDAYFDLMAEVSQTHWWYRARRRWMAQELGPHLAVGARAYDIGCGTADAMATLRELGATPVVGTDLSAHVLGRVASRPEVPAVMVARAERLPFADRTASTLISMDVIEHLDDDVAALGEFRRVLRPGGAVFLTVPAYAWLWSEHDERAAHRRRYSRTTLVRVVEEAGFAVDRATYLFSFLVPLAAVVRRTPMRRFFAATDEETSTVHPAIEAVFARMAALEQRAGRRFDIPFGLSILVVAHWPGDPSPSGR
ncbi:MAG: methyltransferase domain-containing protein [Acidimicrobiia bacterium]|nr:methyltransferase domain-containing protein [Acidimicrobiia bacterium]